MVTLKVDKLAKSYASEPVFKGLSFQFRGGVIGIAGPNGSGKSTLMRCVTGLTRPTSGTVTWSVNGDEYSTGTIPSMLGYSAPYVNLYEELTTSENLAFIRDLRSSQECEAIPELVQRFDLTEFADSPFGDLSSGQQQRVKLAVAAVHRPAILCLDEPGTNLDEPGHRIVEQMIRSCAENSGLVLLASNQPRELDLCDHILPVAGAKK
ncbi:ABC transporter ATP-binding protein [Rhodohalobacter sp. 8-1]|uniref:ABC transporter ATP-binding protein n=1 Tax=Rhodohalobacter sp. 8-1 TaxID=3131972 RepID=UPI0030EC69DE